MPNLPASARQIHQYPEGVPTGGGGGNAGASTGWSGSGGSAPPDKVPIRDSYNSSDRQLERAGATAAAGLHGVTNAPGQGQVQPPANFWKAKENAAVARDARMAVEAAQRARHEQKMGYLSRGMGLPATSDTKQDAYWAREDMKMWAENNKALAKQQGWVEGKDYGNSPFAPDTSGEPDPAGSYDVKLPQGGEAAAAPTSLVLTPEQVQSQEPGFVVGQRTAPIDTTTAFAEQSAPAMNTAASFTPEQLAQSAAGDILNSFKSTIQASRELKPEMVYEAAGADFDEADRNAYGNRFNTRQFF